MDTNKSETATDKEDDARGHVLSYHAFNFVTALALLVLFLPVSLTVIFVIWFKDGRPIFYVGERLGKDKKPFYMYKFRTLHRDADVQLEGELLGTHLELLTHTGSFLRATKLDELPQLWNVLKREMDLFGPRPVRPVIYETLCRTIPNYDRRFEVRPGVIGYSQLYTPHSTPKRLRVGLDNRYLRQKYILSWNFTALFRTGVVFVRMLLIKSVVMLWKHMKMRLLNKQEKRNFERIRQVNTYAYTAGTNKDGEMTYLGEVLDMNEEALLLRSHTDLGEHFQGEIKLLGGVYKRRKSATKTKQVKCVVSVYRRSQQEDGTWKYILRYHPISEFNAYLIHQYFLLESVA